MQQTDAGPSGVAAIEPRVTIAAHKYRQPNQCWTEEQDAILRRDWAEKVSCRTISIHINDQFGTGYTKNSIIGRASRLGLPSNKYVRPRRLSDQDGGIRKHLEASIRQMRLPRRLALPPPPQDKILPPKPIFFGLDLVTLKANQCRDPGESEGPFLFCGQPTKQDSSYCSYHHELNHTESRKTMRPIVAAQSTQILEAAE